MSKNSKFLKLSNKFKILRKAYYFYNIFIRNYKFLNNGSQFGEEKIILDCFEKNHKGNFVDIGCFHPTRHNNTYTMYKKGWRGINIDLNPLTIELFKFLRPEDTNINTAISDKKEEKTMYFIDELNTQNTLDKNHLNFVQNHHNVKDEEIEKRNIKTETFENILVKNDCNKIDFLNIDVEGHELKIVENIDFDKFFIKVICVEMINYNEISKQNNKIIKKILFEKNYSLLKQIDFNYIYKKNE